VPPAAGPRNNAAAAPEIEVRAKAVIGMTRFGTEVKFTLPADQVAAGRAAFGLTDDDADELKIHFLDRLDDFGDPWLLGQRVVLRIRCAPDDSGDVTVKLRPARLERLTGRWRPGTEHRADYTVEFDWAREQVLAASVKAEYDSGIADLLDGPPKKALTHEQQDFLRKCGPGLEQPMRGLRKPGPIAARRWKNRTAGPVDELRAEQWTWGAGRSFLELSLRCETDEEATRRRALLAAEIERHGLKLDDAAVTKTEAVLRDLL
jgi:hypothetical protein